MVFAISPISYPDNFRKKIIADDILPIELVDTPENIFERLVFSDENDRVYTDDKYKNQRRDFYIEDIQEDIKWYGSVYSQIGISNKFEIRNESPYIAAERLLREYNLYKY